jgi:hypothetical protein
VGEVARGGRKEGGGGRRREEGGARYNSLLRRKKKNKMSNPKKSKNGQMSKNSLILENIIRSLNEYAVLRYLYSHPKTPLRHLFFTHVDHERMIYST